MRSTPAAVVVKVGAVPPMKSQLLPQLPVLLPVPSCVMKIEPVCPAVGLDGFANVALWAKVTLKLLLSLKSIVIVAADVNAVKLDAAAPIVMVVLEVLGDTASTLISLFLDTSL